MDQNGGISTIGGNRATTSTTNNTTRATTPSDSGSWINYRHFITIAGLLKIVEIIFSIIVVATASPVVFNGTHFVLFVGYTTLVITFLWIIIIFFRIDAKIRIFQSWLLFDFIYSIVACWLYSVAAAVQFSLFSVPNYIFVFGDPVPRSEAAASFALFNCVAYGAGVYYAFLNWRSDTVGQQSTSNGRH